MNGMRIGQGFDVHQLVAGRRLVIGGVEIAHDKGLLGHSDADVLLHAICDALLGAAALGDIGRHFPDSDARYKGIDSRELLRRVAGLVREEGYEPVNVDATIIAEAPRMAPHIPAMVGHITSDVGLAESKPEQVLGQTRGQGAGLRDQVRHPQVLGQHAEGGHGAIGQHPGVLAAAALLHGEQAGVLHARHPRQAARQHGVAFRRRRGIHPQPHGAVDQATPLPARPGRRAGELDQLLGDPGRRIGGDADAQGVTLGLVELVAEDDLAETAGEGGLDDQGVEVAEHVVQGRIFAAPPGGDGRHGQLLLEQMPADAGQEAGQRGGFEQAGAEGVGHQHAAGTHGAEQAGHAEGGIGAQLDRIAEVVVEAAQDGVDALQAGDGLEEDGVVPHREVLPFHQRETQVAGRCRNGRG